MSYLHSEASACLRPAYLSKKDGIYSKKNYKEPF